MRAVESQAYFLRSGDVWFGRPDAPGRHVCGGGELLAVCYSREGDELLRHKLGACTAVTAWADNARARLSARAAGGEGEDAALATEMAAAIEVVAFPVTEETVALLNHIASGRSMDDLLARLTSIGEAHANHPALSIPR